MATFRDIVRVCGKEQISISDIDRVLVSRETYDTFRQNMKFKEDVETSDYATVDGPALRITSGEEKVVYVDSAGREVEASLE